MSRHKTSYEIKWRRNDTDGIGARPHTRTRWVGTQLFLGEDGEPLFTVVTHGGPSEGIFTLINEAPRIRDEVGETEDKLSESLSALERLYENALRIFDKAPVRDWEETLGEARTILDKYGILDE